MIGLVVLLATVLALPAQSAMWVGGDLGATFIGNSDIDVRVTAPGVAAAATAGNVHFDNPQVIGGLTIGYDFVNTGFGGYAYPEWMKYFSFATDFTYNRMSIRSQNLHLNNINVNGNIIQPFNLPVNVALPGTRMDGYMMAWTFLFMAHYGFLPDSEVPTGRLVPYVGVGPCILFTKTNLKSFGGSWGSTDLALVAEGGLRFMALKNVSIDLAFRYRYAQPSTYEFGSAAVQGIGVSSVKLDTTVNSYSILTRVSYHF